MGSLAAAADIEERQFDELFATNVRGPYFLLKHAVPVLSDGASIILTAATSALRAVPSLSAYSASKAALRSLGITLAVELAPRKIRVNTITPGPINTPIGGKMGLTPEQKAGFGEMIARVPLNRLGEAEEVAAAALYFASDESPECQETHHLRPEKLAADKAYGTGPFLGWLTERRIIPHIPVLD